MSRRPKLQTVDGTLLDESDDRLLDSQSAARFLGYQSDGPLKKWRLVGVGPHWIKLGGYVVRYRLGDLKAWVASGARLEDAA